MSRLSRFTQLIFGSSAGSNQIAEFGSLYASAPATYSGSTITPALVQGLSNYLLGWFNAAIGSNSPAIEDMNALCYLFSYQLAYILQVGIPEWDSGTTYFTNNIVSSSGVLYISLINSNLNNTPSSNPSDWGPFPSGLTGANLVSNINLPGKAVQENSNNLVVSNTNATNSLAIVRGHVNSGGSPGGGEGFSSSNTGTGGYSVSFSTTFGDTPCITCVSQDNGIFPIGIQSKSSSGFAISMVNMTNTPQSAAWDFIAIGQRA